MSLDHLTDAPSASLRRTWCEIDTDALKHNITTLRGLLSSETWLMPVVKSNAYGHGLLLCAQTFLEAGVDGLCIDALHEALCLRDAGIQAKLYILGHVPPAHAEALVESRCSVVLYSEAQALAFAQAARARGASVPVHVKLETGNHRQGLPPDEALQLIEQVEALDGVHLEGVSSHFANIEDTTDHRYADQQLVHFNTFLSQLSEAKISPPRANIANSAATILWPQSHFGLVRPGIVCYGLWPSRETLLSTMLAGQTPISLRPALRWRTIIAQIKELPAGVCIGYGGTFQTTHQTRLAILPVGYYDGYDRGFSNLAYVLINGQRAPLRGRVCMNMVMVDVTDIPSAKAGVIVTLLGPDGHALLCAETLAAWLGSISYEVTTHIHEAIPRVPQAGFL